jgi:hypothetical protein
MKSEFYLDTSLIMSPFVLPKSFGGMTIGSEDQDVRKITGSHRINSPMAAGEIAVM